MKYKCIVVDDEELARRLIERYVSELEDFELITSCESAIEAQKVLSEKEVNLMFLDIEMPLIKGTDFLNSMNNRPNVIFTTAFREYAVEGFELNVVDYLLKPISFSRFFKSIEKFRGVVGAVNKVPEIEHIYVRSNKKNIKVVLDDILYIESLRDYIKIYLKNQKVVYKEGISSFEKRLNKNFLRVHRSFIVNKKMVSAFTKSDVEIGDVEIPIGESYKEIVLQEIIKQ